MKRSSTQIIGDLEKMPTNLDDVTLALQVSKMREKALKAQVEDLKKVVQVRSETIFNSTKAAEAHWQEKFTAVKVTHALKRRRTLVKLEKSIRIKAVQRSWATSAEKASAVLRERMEMMMTEKERLTARCDELALENKVVSGLQRRRRKRVSFM